ncbi:receptor kinase-like protein Xa21 [Hordeum vulgare subsp. vulgare]|uniref:Receptor kinase-like protein Xa21 n=1 Tax=Hordeum vulgare subsp. vulgare TaxID=112509 RepID=A0A8I6YUL8_HORVV|nr:receptor kinase-like protein Xa21 [Hordeum vulgare subsp. vulgare]KAI4984449.1 hypothetical protein ZWY2020_017079 [Hordeum vulgare]
MTLLLISLALCILPSLATTGDELALLSFKSTLPGGALASWSAPGSYCRWPGVVCGGRRHPERVVALRLPAHNLTGRLSPSLGNLSFLRELDFSDNQLVGQIPPELGRLVRLRVLNLSDNLLQGSIPAALGRCTRLTRLDLHNNKLQGGIPPRLAELTSMEYMSLARNTLSGEIPPSLANLSNLSYLALSANMLSGVIPSSFGMLSSLSAITLGSNNLSGSIPVTFWNITTLKSFVVRNNMLSGTIPPNAFNNLPNIQMIRMDINQFHGPIPPSIANASRISEVQLNYNFFSGHVPPELGMLRDLYWLQMENNLFQAKGPQDWEFITALTNCSKLEVLGLNENKLEGALPLSISNLSTSLIHLELRINGITGSIPEGIGNLVNLQRLVLMRNSFTGTLPSSLGRLKNLGGLTVAENKISGSIPWTIGNLTKLNYLDLNMNSFSGGVPITFGNLTKLFGLNLSSNNLTGPIPSGLFNIPTLSGYFYLSNNNLVGSIPQEIGNLKNLVEFRAESNKLSGEIPTTLVGCQLLRSLSLQNNILSGSIPLLLSDLKGLETLDLSSNNFSGLIPKSLGNLTMLHYLNLSFNNFVGEVPTTGVFSNVTIVSIQGNNKLCGGISDLHLPPCALQSPKRRHKLLVVLVVSSTSVVTLAIIVLLYKLLSRHMKNKEAIPSTTPIQGHPMVSYSQLVKATDEFSKTNLLGSGAFGSVYKGELDGEAGERTIHVAVKVLKLQTRGALKSFIAECEALRNLRHRNLLKIVTACSSIDTRGDDFRAIVYNFMPNGSLEGWLHPDKNNQEEQKHLNLHQRVTILLDVAYALDYLHCHGSAPTIHCDVKSSNVLLDAEMIAHVGDFGLAKILVEGSSILQQSTSSMGFRGTIGYAAPEYGAGNTVSTYGDIYSYGILVLETITGKRPTDSFNQGLTLRAYVELCLHDRAMDVVDTQLSLDLESELHIADAAAYTRTEDCLIQLLKLGVSCSQELPSSRMPTGAIIKELRAIKESLCGNAG